MGLWRGRFRHGHRRERYWTRRPKLTVSILPPPSRQQRAANVVSPRCGCHLTVADKALLHNAQFVIIRPIPAAFTIGSRQNFDLRAVDKVGHKGGLTIGANTSSDGRPRRLTVGARWGKVTGVISTDMILGVTLIGMLVGQCAHLLRDNGSVRSGTVSRVIHSI